MNNAIKAMLAPYQNQDWEGQERALREVIQEVALVGLWRGRFFDKAAFYGGTALRILYGLDRFSEDLDFTLLKPSKSFSWEEYAPGLITELESFGLSVSVNGKSKKNWSAVKSAFLKTNTVHHLLKIGVPAEDLKGVHPSSEIRIKVEVDTEPPYAYDVETKYLTQPVAVPILCVKEEDLFVGKFHAALFRGWKNRVKGRDWFDIFWFIRRKIPLNLKKLEESFKAHGDLSLGTNLTEEKFLKMYLEKVETLDLAKAKEDMLPFVRDKRDLDVWTKDFFLYWAKEIVFAENNGR